MTPRLDDDGALIRCADPVCPFCRPPDDLISRILHTVGNEAAGRELYDAGRTVVGASWEDLAEETRTQYRRLAAARAV